MLGFFVKGVFAILAVLVLATFCNLPSEPEQLTEEVQRQRKIDRLAFNAVFFCEHAVRQQLVAPSTAVFEPGTRRNRQFDVDPDSGIVRLRHFVDSQNRFGAMIRTRFFCEARHTGQRDSEGWRVTEILLFP